MTSAQPAPPDNQVNEDAWDGRFEVRAGVADDRAFIEASWRRSYSPTPWTRCPGGLEEYKATQGKVIETALASSAVLVAYPAANDQRPARPEQILGWLCHRGPVLHYLYVKPYYRRQGLAKALIVQALAGAAVAYTTHGVSRRGEACALLTWLTSYGRELNHNPALIFGGTT